MSTVIRPELSGRNKYYISKHRYYELKHYCLQYHEWEDELKELNSCPLRCNRSNIYIDPILGDMTAEVAIRKIELQSKMQQIKDLCRQADPSIWSYIFVSVTEGKSFTYLKMTLEMPAERDMFYDRYRKFFWLLNSHK